MIKNTLLLGLILCGVATMDAMENPKLAQQILDRCNEKKDLLIKVIDTARNASNSTSYSPYNDKSVVRYNFEEDEVTVHLGPNREQPVTLSYEGFRQLLTTGHLPEPQSISSVSTESVRNEPKHESNDASSSPMSPFDHKDYKKLMTSAQALKALTRGFLSGCSLIGLLPIAACNFLLANRLYSHYVAKKPAIAIGKYDLANIGLLNLGAAAGAFTTYKIIKYFINK